MADQKAYRKRLKALMNKPENQICADCDEKQPRWASLIVPPPGCPLGNYKIGAFMCLECSGSHRRLGVHIAFVRSINLDSWKEKEVLAMENGGNGRVNAMFEAHLGRSGVTKPTNQANGFTREKFIRDKYERRKFYDPAGLSNYVPDDDDYEEEAPVRAATRTVKKPIATVRAPSEAARRRAESRQARLAAAGNIPADRPARIGGVKAPAPAPPKPPAPAPAASADLLDFASFPEPSSAPAPAAPAKNETLDLFASMSVSAEPPAAKTSNDHIMSLFNTPQTQTGGMVAGGNMMMGGQPMNPAMMQQMMAQQQQMKMMMMMQQQQQGSMAQQQPNNMMQQPPNNMMQQQPNMMPQQQHNMMQQQPNNMMQQQPNNMMQANNMMQQQPNMMQQQMMNQGNYQMQGGGGMVQQQMNPRTMMMQNGMMPAPTMQQPQAGMAPMGSGPSISAMQGTSNASTPQQPQKEDPFAQFGFNAFQ